MLFSNITRKLHQESYELSMRSYEFALRDILARPYKIKHRSFITQ